MTNNELSLKQARPRKSIELVIILVTYSSYANKVKVEYLLF